MFVNRNRVCYSTAAIFSLVWLAGISGCGYKAPYSCEKVSGKVMYEDGSLIPAPRMRVTFISTRPPVDAKTPPKNGIAEVNVKTGQFDYVTTFDFQDGIIAGEHKVIVQCLAGDKMLKLVPAEYSDPDKTPLKFQSSGSPFVIKVPKPH